MICGNNKTLTYMNFIRYIDRLERIDRMIQLRSTGSPVDFAKRLDISKRQLFRTLEILKDYGAPISYSRSLGSFYYDDPTFEIQILFSMKFINEKEIIDIYGGSKFNFPQCYFLAINKANLTVQFSA